MSILSTATPIADDTGRVFDLDNLGIIAGEGDFPLLVARAARSRSIPVTAIGVIGLTSPELEALATTMHWIKFGKLDQAIRLLQASGARKLVMVGRVNHSLIYKLSSIDMRGMKLMAKMANKKADTILGLVVKELARENLEVLDSTLFLKDCMPPSGLLTPNFAATPELMKDFRFGIKHAKSLAGLDIGQSLAVKSKSIVAVEAMEGTDQMIERAGQVAGPGIVLCKVAKPNQDRRFDVPVLGLTTICKLVEAKASGLSFPGGEILFFDREEAIALAEANGLCIFAI
jgi:hypothetical protein